MNGMNAYQIGAELRAHILRHQRQGPVDAKRLQALVADFCGGEQHELIAPLRHLLSSSTFAIAAGTDPPLGDQQNLQILSHELAQVFSPLLCDRLQPVLQGLMGVAETHPISTRSAAPPSAVSASTTSELATRAVTSPSVGGGGKTSTNAVLAFLSGVLLMTLAGVVLLVWQRQSTLAPAAPDTSTSAPAGAPEINSDPINSRALPVQPEPRSESSDQPITVSVADHALRSIQDLYNSLSAKDFEKSRLLYGSGAADQFTPGFFNQFERVTTQDLRITSQTGSTVNLEGAVTFVWPDGSLQSETRSFSVDTSTEPALITASEFGRVITPRR